MAFVPCDLATADVGMALATAGHDSSRATLFVAEHCSRTCRLPRWSSPLRATSERRGPGDRLAVELGLVPHDVQSRINVGVLRTVTAVLGEPILTVQEPHDAVDMLRRCGWTPWPPDPALDARAQGRLVLWLLAE